MFQIVNGFISYFYSSFLTFYINTKYAPTNVIIRLLKKKIFLEKCKLSCLINELCAF